MADVNEDGFQLSIRERLIEVAERLAAEKGLEAVSVRDIAREANASLSAINYHFGSKTELLAQIVRKIMSDIDAVHFPLIDRLEGQTDVTLREVIEAIFTPTVRWSLADPGKAVTLQFLSHALVTPHPEIQNAFVDHAKSVGRLIALLGKAMPGTAREESGRTRCHVIDR